jgi:hypothetical protein
LADRRFSLVIVVAIIVAVGSGFGVFSVLRTAKASASATSTVLVAATDLPDGHVLVSADVKPALLPSAAIPAGAYTTADSVIGRVTRMPVIAGEPMVAARFVPVGVGAGLEVRIARGKRAMAVRIDDVAGLANPHQIPGTILRQQRRRELADFLPGFLALAHGQPHQKHHAIPHSLSKRLVIPHPLQHPDSHHQWH